MQRRSTAHQLDNSGPGGLSGLGAQQWSCGGKVNGVGEIGSVGEASRRTAALVRAPLIKRSTMHRIGVMVMLDGGGEVASDV